MSFSDDLVLRAIGVDHSPISRRHLRRFLAYRPIAHRARHSGAAAVAGVLPVARAVPWFVGMVFTYPTRPAANLAFRRFHLTTPSPYFYSAGYGIPSPTGHSRLMKQMEWRRV